MIDELRQIRNNEELLERIVQMARDEGVPEEDLNTDDLKALGKDYVKDIDNRDIFETHETVLALFREGKEEVANGRW